MGSSSWVVERAVEELRTLEAEHPDRFDHLKRELEAFISESLLHSFPTATSPSSSHHLLLLQNPPPPSASSATTQASSNRKRKKRKSGEQIQIVGGGFGGALEQRSPESRAKGAKDSADMALERAEACLRKIRRVKESLANGG